MATKTEEYLRILAEGGDAPADCCMTNTQKLIVQAIERINNLGGGGDIVDLTPYFDMQTFSLDVEAVTPIVEEGGHLYSLTISVPGEAAMTIYFSAAVIADGMIQFVGIPVIDQTSTSADISSYSLSFDASTGAIDPTSMATHPIHLTTTQNGYVKNSQKLQIILGGTTYEYDGSDFVRIRIADGENMGF